VCCGKMTDKDQPKIEIPFEPIDPWNSERQAVTRRNLPHFQVLLATYFVTFRTLRRRELSPVARDVVFSTITECDGDSIDLDALVVMPDHVHTVFRLMGRFQLSPILQRLKGRSAYRVNQKLRHQGSVWLDECFDRVVRDGNDLETKIAYIRENPVKKGLVVAAGDYQWLFVKERPGVGGGRHTG
jgi:REP element-mobilizing transposase RayT